MHLKAVKRHQKTIKRQLKGIKMGQKERRSVKETTPSIHSISSSEVSSASDVSLGTIQFYRKFSSTLFLIESF